MRGGQKGFGWGRVCHNGAARDSRASTLILCHFVLHRVIPNHTMCYHATTMAAAMGLTDRMFAIMATHTASEEGIHTNVGDIRWQSCPDPLCTHNH